MFTENSWHVVSHHKSMLSDHSAGVSIDVTTRTL